VDEAALEAFFQKLEALKPGDILVLAGKPPASLPQDIYAQILKTIANRSVRTVVDTVDHFLLEALPYRPFLIKPNRQELADLFGIDTLRDEDLELYTGKLQKQGARNVLVSLGKDGAFLLDEQGVPHRVPTVQGKVVGTVGAGDSMVAGFLTGYLQTGDYEQALRLGNACGMATAFSDWIGDKDAIRRCWDLQESLLQNDCH
ncbi:MAG: 1-phosphofructokinase, partial [Clostridia bacterium]|nr:1-phosphofructokinase [Clostridia bacterium]